MSELTSLSPLEFEAFILVARKHKVLAFELGELKVTFSQLALVPETAPANPTELRTVADPEAKPLTFRGFTEEQLFSG